MKQQTDLERALKLLGTFTRCTHLLAALEARANSRLAALAERHAHKFATLQSRVTEAETEIKRLAAAHPEWFPQDDRTVKSPLGSIHAQRTTRHELAEDAVAAFREAAAYAFSCEWRHDAEALLRCVVVTEEIDLSAVAALTPDQLSLLERADMPPGAKRVTEDSITVKPAKVKMGNAAKKASGEKKAAKKGVRA